LLFLTFIFTYPVFSQKDTIWPIIQSRTIDKLKCTSKKGIQNLNVKIERAIFKKTDHPDFNETDISITISDSKKNVLYKKSFPNFDDQTLDVSVSSILLDGIGYTLMVHSQVEPGCENCNGDLQMLGLNSLGYLVPFTGIISGCDEVYSKDSLFTIKWVKSRGDLTSGAPTLNYKDCHECQPYLEILHFYGFCGGFSSLGYIPIEREGIFEETANREVDSDRIPLQVGTANFYTINELLEDNPFVNIYTKSDKLSQMKKMPLKKGMTIKFFEGLKRENDTWIHLRIAGYEGYIIIDDVWKLGFSPCD
jgi:hypothetical protein